MVLQSLQWDGKASEIEQYGSTAIIRIVSAFAALFSPYQGYESSA